MSPGERRALLGLLGFLTFAAVYVGVVFAPVLTQIGGEFGITTGTAGLVVAAYGAPGILVAVLTGPYSDRFGRKRFLVAGSLIMGVFTVLSAFATSFPVLVATRMIAGIGSSVIWPNVTATVGDNVPYRERGTAMSTVIGLNTMASVIGIPLAGIVAEGTSWRVSVAIVGVLSIAAAGLIFWKLRPAQTPLNSARVRELYHSIVTNRSALGAIASSLLGALYWFTWATYIVVFFEESFGLSQGLASTFALTQGLGVLVGSQLGGRLGARIGHKPVVAGSVLVSGALLLFQTNLTPPLVPTALLNLALSAVIAFRVQHDAAHRTGSRSPGNTPRTIGFRHQREHRGRRRSWGHPYRRARLLVPWRVLLRGRGARGDGRDAFRPRGADRPGDRAGRLVFAPHMIPCAFAQSCQSGTGWLTV